MFTASILCMSDEDVKSLVAISNRKNIVNSNLETVIDQVESTGYRNVVWEVCRRISQINWEYYQCVMSFKKKK